MAIKLRTRGLQKGHGRELEGRSSNKTQICHLSGYDLGESLGFSIFLSWKQKKGNSLKKLHHYLEQSSLVACVLARAYKVSSFRFNSQHQIIIKYISSIYQAVHIAVVRVRQRCTSYDQVYAKSREKSYVLTSQSCCFSFAK